MSSEQAEERPTHHNPYAAAFGHRDIAATGVSGLDDILNGGLTRDRVYLLEGDPGTGKTTLALQFLLHGAAQGETGLYVTMSETRMELTAVAASHGWSLDSITVTEVTPVEAALPENNYTVFHPEEVELGETTKLILQEVERVQPKRLVLDSLAELRLLARDALRYRRQALALKQYFVGKAMTVLLLDDRTSQTQDRQLHSVVHGVLTLERLPRDYGQNRRRIEIGKLRGSQFIDGYHDYTIQRGGLAVFPRLIAAQHGTEFPHDLMKSGVGEIDSVLGGGLDPGSATLFMGPSGSGKSTLAAKYVHTALQEGARAAIYSFDEGLESLQARTECLGIPLQPYTASGQLLLEQVDPAELSPGEFVSRVRHGVEKDGRRVIVIDSLNGYLAAMPEEQFLTLQMHELLNYLNRQGVITILVMAQQGVLGQLPAVLDVSYLADTILLLRFFEAQGELRRAISVVKKRSSDHERSIRELRICSPGGIEVGQPLRDFHGVLTGVPEYSL